MPGRQKRAERERMLSLVKPDQPVKSEPRRPTAIPGAGMRVRATCPLCGLRATVFRDPDREELPSLQYPVYEVQVWRQYFGGVKGAKGAESRGAIIYEEVPEAQLPLTKAMLVNLAHVARMLIDSLGEQGLMLSTDLGEAVAQLGDLDAIWREVEAVTGK